MLFRSEQLLVLLTIEEKSLKLNAEATPKPSLLAMLGTDQNITTIAVLQYFNSILIPIEEEEVADLTIIEAGEAETSTTTITKGALHHSLLSTPTLPTLHPSTTLSLQIHKGQHVKSATKWDILLLIAITK